jgi:preprotein translocase subunit SecG
MYTLLIVLHVIVAIATILIILVQTSKGSGLDSSLGGAASQVLGGQSAPAMLKKLTRILVAVFFVLCASLAFFNEGRTRGRSASAVQKLRESAQTEQSLPAGEAVPLEEVPLELPAAGQDSL